jgi:hypothetical protein
MDGDPFAGLVDIKIDDDWRKTLQHYPALLTGGATLVEKDDAVYLVAVGSAPDQSRQAETIARSDAQRAVVKFANGFTTRATDEAREELVTVEKDLKEKILRDTEVEIRRINQEASGVIPGLTSIGRWRSTDGARVYMAFATKLGGDIPK